MIWCDQHNRVDCLACEAEREASHSPALITVRVDVAPTGAAPGKGKS